MHPDFRPKPIFSCMHNSAQLRIFLHDIAMKQLAFDHFSDSEIAE